ncbi:MAG: O-antigen ligase family protein, partial [Terracidiphilus sp.]
MGLVILIPAVLCWAALARGGARAALVWVWLPCVLLLPSYYILRFSHMPPFHFADMAILPIGAALAAGHMRRWRLDWMDLWVFLYAFSFALSEAMPDQLANGDWKRFFTASEATSRQLSATLSNGEFAFFGAICSMVLPYMAGKLLMESAAPGQAPARRAAVRCMLFCLALVTVLSLRDFLTGGSIWQNVFHHFFPDQVVEWPLQKRWGFGRITGPFAHAILAGMIFLAGSVYSVWLLRVDRRWGRVRLMAGLPFLLRTVAISAIVAGLLMTQSRGPWIGVGLAGLLVLLLRHLGVVRAAVLFTVIAGGLLAFAWGLGSRYTQGAQYQATSQEQASAIYRRQLLKSYTPVIRERPLFGWGFTDYPAANGQKSIDNEFLWLAVTQGLVGLSLFVVIATGSGLRLLLLASRPASAEDRGLIYAHMAVLLGLFSTLATVYMGEQVVLLFFFIIGWIQGMTPAPARAGELAVPAPRF